MGQQATRLLTGQATPLTESDSPNILGVAYDGVDWRIWAFNKWKVFDTVGKFATKTNLLAKFDKPIGTTAQYVRGDGSLATLPIAATYTAGSGISIVGGVISSTYIPTINLSPARSLNSNYTPSASRPTLGIYTISCSTTNPLLVGTSSANIYAEYSTNAGSTWNSISQNGSSNGVGLTVTIQLQVGQVTTLVVPIKEGWLVRLRTATSGTATVNLTDQKEFNF